jgi:hypothetical protein
VQDPAARDVLSRFVAARTALMTVVVDRAVQRGEVPAGTDAAGVIQIVTAQIYYGLFLAANSPARPSPTAPPQRPPRPPAPTCPPRLSPAYAPVSAPCEVPENERPAVVTANVRC